VTTTEAQPGRPPLLLQALGAVVVSSALMGLGHAGQLPLLVGVAVLQLLLLLGVLALVDAPGALGAFALGVGTAVAADVVVHLDDGEVGDLAGVAALALVGGLLLQLLRRGRDRVTEALADAMVAVVLLTAAACLPAVLQAEDGEVLLRVGLLAAGAALVVGRVADLLLRRLAVSPDATRGWHGLVLALGVGVAVAVPEAGDHLTDRDAMLVGLACAATAALADLFLDLAASELLVRADDRRLVSLRPVVSLLPFALVAPVLLTAARLLSRS
jgi:hypothetical protein